MSVRNVGVITRRLLLGNLAAAGITFARAEPIRIAIVDFSGVDGVVGTVTATIVGDLVGTGNFTRIDPAAYAGEHASIGSVPRLAAWRELGAGALVMGRIERVSDDGLRGEFQLLDVAAGHFVLGQQLSVAENQLVMLAHLIAGEVYQRLTGQKRTFE
jgi:TolB protein